ncbi:MAG: gamma-glutamyltransferase [Thermodesulfobacteriota bacterium]
MKAIVAAGHHLVAEAAMTMLAEGGNAFDAAVAAGFMAAMAEPGLTSLGGGGFLLAQPAQGEATLFDFFSDTPGIGLSGPTEPHFYPVTIGFSGSEQDFHVGRGSVAVPGCLAGYLHVHQRLGRLPLARVVAPAREAAGQGVVVTEQQAHFFTLLEPILTMSPAGQRIYAAQGRLIRAGERLHNHDYAGFLESLAREGQEASFYQGGLAARIAQDMRQGDGLLTAQDLGQYRVLERQPLRSSYRGKNLLCNPPPSMGGTLLAQALSLLESYDLAEMEFGSADHLLAHAQVMAQVEESRKRPQCSRGTTHVSIADHEGNLAAMTTSNGEGSGYIVPGSGIMLNNMMGEDDLHPDGFHAHSPGQRVASMMCPAVVMAGQRPLLVLGSGGSKRIRTAIGQVISHLLDFNLDIETAVTTPRLHFDGEVVQIEPGWPAESVRELAKNFPVNLWQKKGVYFGGVHGVAVGQAGGGDPRRGGCWLSA